MKLFSIRSQTHVISVLRAQHRLTEDQFARYRKAHDNARRAALASEICQNLSIHTHLEEKLLYQPLLRQLNDRGHDLAREAEVEHEAFRRLMLELQGTLPDRDLFDARMTVLREYVEHHVKEEEKELFPLIEKLDADFEAIGAKLLAETGELTALAAAQAKPARGKPKVRVVFFDAPVAAGIATPRRLTRARTRKTVTKAIKRSA